MQMLAVPGVVILGQVALAMYVPRNMFDLSSGTFLGFLQSCCAHCPDAVNFY